MPKHANFDFSNQNVVAAHLLFLHQPQLTELFKMVEGYAGATEVEGTLNLADTNGITVF